MNKTEKLHQKVALYKKEFPALQRLEEIILSMSREDISEIAEFADSFEFGLVDFITSINATVNPSDYIEFNLILPQLRI